MIIQVIQFVHEIYFLYTLCYLFSNASLIQKTCLLFHASLAFLCCVSSIPVGQVCRYVDDSRKWLRVGSGMGGVLLGAYICYEKWAEVFVHFLMVNEWLSLMDTLYIMLYMKI